jgi:hypothetical protein
LSLLVVLVVQQTEVQVPEVVVLVVTALPQEPLVVALQQNLNLTLLLELPIRLQWVLAVLVLLLNRVTVAATLCFPLLHPQAVGVVGETVAALQVVLVAVVVALARVLLVVLGQPTKATLAGLLVAAQVAQLDILVAVAAAQVK